MGSLFSMFNKKLSTKSLLSNIQNEIESIEEYKYSATKRHKNYIVLLFIISTLIYITSALVCYFVYYPKTVDLIHKLLYLIPFIVSPLIVYGLKRALQWYYRWTIDNKDERLRQLKKQKRKILETVQETETFKDAKEILEKYDPKALAEISRKNFDTMSTSMERMNSPQINVMNQTSQSNSQLRYRGISLTPMRPLPRITQFRQPSPQMPNSSRYTLQPRISTPIQFQRLAIMPPMMTGPRTAKPILPQHRGVMEKIVDYIVGDGPSNRYALICNYCYSHNGMALKEEFEFISFNCCYCGKFNESRKTRPLPPSLPSSMPRRASLPPVVDEPESDNDSTKGVLDNIKHENDPTLKIEDITSDNEDVTTNNQNQIHDKLTDTTNNGTDNIESDTQTIDNLEDNITSENSDIELIDADDTVIL